MAFEGQSEVHRCLVVGALVESGKWTRQVKVTQRMEL
jgi:hypothetical protein